MYQVTRGRRMVTVALLVVNIIATLWAIIANPQSFPAPAITLPILITMCILQELQLILNQTSHGYAGGRNNEN